jgi:hypothetical protein
MNAQISSKLTALVAALFINGLLIGSVAHLFQTGNFADAAPLAARTQQASGAAV